MIKRIYGYFMKIVLTIGFVALAFLVPCSAIGGIPFLVSAGISTTCLVIVSLWQVWH